jgi:hypothetical protein
METKGLFLPGAAVLSGVGRIRLTSAEKHQRSVVVGLWRKAQEVRSEFVMAMYALQAQVD